MFWQEKGGSGGRKGAGRAAFPHSSGLCPTLGARGAGECGCYVRHRHRSFTAEWSEYSITCKRHLCELLFICSSGLNLSLAVGKLMLLLSPRSSCPASCSPAEGSKGDLLWEALRDSQSNWGPTCLLFNCSQKLQDKGNGPSVTFFPGPPYPSFPPGLKY